MDEVRQFLCDEIKDFIPIFDLQKIIIKDYYLSDEDIQLYKNIQQYSKISLVDTVKLFEGYNDYFINDLSTIFKNFKIETLHKTYCDLCKRLSFHYVYYISNYFGHVYPPNLNGCDRNIIICQRCQNICGCQVLELPTFNDLTENAIQYKLLKCHLCDEYKCRIHKYKESQTICFDCKNIFKKLAMAYKNKLI